jgi:nicotinamide phosphoribosyltransferase
MKKQVATLLCDFYKVSHRNLYPKGTEVVYSTWTPRQSLLPNVNSIVSFGFQKFVKEFLIEFFNENFFNRPKEEVVKEYNRVITYTLGLKDPDSQHIEALHNLGYLPLSIKALPEGTLVPTRVPMLTVENTHPEFFWVTNYIESLASCELWQPSTSATLAFEYKKLLTQYAKDTGGDLSFVQFQAHDFSMRGLSSLQSSISSGMGHLLSFTGTDTIPAILGHEEFYNANIEKELVGTSIPATEHSIQCAYGNDEEYIRDIITNKNPTGMVSVVSDGYDFWNVVGNILPRMKSEIMARDGKLVIRPDSGDPVKIVVGDPESTDLLIQKGLIESLWETFGGTVNEKGYKVLDSHIGAIYGDSITLKRAREICEGLKNKGFCSTNIVFGVGSFTYQYNTRDTFGFAMKATSVTISGDEKQIFKAPKTDNGVKKSQKGRVIVMREEGINIMSSDYQDIPRLIDGLTSDDVEEFSNINMMKEIFRDGKLLKETTLSEIRERLNSSL